MTLHLEPTPRDRMRGTVCDIVFTVSAHQIACDRFPLFLALSEDEVLRVAELTEEEFGITIPMAALMKLARLRGSLGDLLGIIEEAQNARAR